MDRLLAWRALLAALVVGVVAQALVVNLEAGVNAVVLTVVILAVAAVFARLAGSRMDLADAWIPIAAIAVAAGTSIRADETLVFLDAVTAAILVGASVAAFSGAAITRRSIDAIVGLGTFVLAWSGVGILRLTQIAARSDAGAPRRSLPAPTRAVVRGVALAVPVLLVFGVLFASADAIFATFAESLFDWQVDLGELPLRGSLAFAVAWVVAGLLSVATGLADPFAAGVRTAATSGDAPPAMQSLGAAVAATVPAPPAAPRLGAVEALTVLVAVDALFGVFVALQLAYLFGGLDTMAAGGITYAEYARRGFFELVAVVCLSGCLVVGLHSFVAQRTRAFVVAAVGLALLTAAVLASAALRLGLYQDAYGWTELRFYVAATIAWLALGIAAAVLLLVRNRMRWLAHAMTVAAVAVLVGINAIGPQRLVAEANVARLLNPALVPPDGKAGIDLYYAMSLGADAIPALVLALPALEPADRATLTIWLEGWSHDLDRPEFTGWPAWNLARQRAGDALGPVFAE